MSWTKAFLTMASIFSFVGLLSAFIFYSAKYIETAYGPPISIAILFIGSICMLKFLGGIGK